jgi:lipoate-protein ligase B
VAHPAFLLDLGRTDYRPAHDLQCAAAAARRTGQLDRELIILLEHSPVFTLGRRGGRSNLNVSEAFLKTRGIAVEQAERGGDITYHGPGQLVAYLIVDLNQTRMRVTEFVTCLETAMIKTAAHWQVLARGNTLNRGAWVGRRKLGSVGLTVRRGITFHGLALNINTDLEPFTWINPCGLPDCAMTTLAQESCAPIDLKEAKQQLARHLSDELHLAPAPIASWCPLKQMGIL